MNYFGFIIDNSSGGNNNNVVVPGRNENSDGSDIRRQDTPGFFYSHNIGFRNSGAPNILDDISCSFA
jgi:hypothetical protein